MNNLWGTVTSGVIIGGILLVLGFFGWLWKRSIYGTIDTNKKDCENDMQTIREDAKIAMQAITERVNAEILKMSDAMGKNYMKKQDILLCEALRNGCQHTMAAQVASVESKISLILERQGQVIERIDAALMEMGRRK